MGLMDRAKGLIEEHRGQVEQGLHKATDAFNKIAGGQGSSATATASEPEASSAELAPEAAGQDSPTEANPAEADETTEVTEESSGPE